uniref:Kazal-like domain-containing protein n=1 Tax=Hyaloperonospora arabidopsidis (strain Emoy2) TaxID=559515 RepID=M4B9B8_HYAAE
MRVAKCKAKEKEVDVVEEYEKLYGKRSGASRDDDVNKSVGNDDTSEDDAASKVDGRDEDPPQVKCPNVLCPDVYSPVTDEKGNEYSNQCYMDVAKCKGPKENLLDKYKRIYSKEFGADREDESKTKSGEKSLRQ